MSVRLGGRAGASSLRGTGSPGGGTAPSNQLPLRLAYKVVSEAPPSEALQDCIFIGVSTQSWGPVCDASAGHRYCAGESPWFRKTRELPERNADGPSSTRGGLTHHPVVAGCGGRAEPCHRQDPPGLAPPPSDSEAICSLPTGGCRRVGGPTARPWQRCPLGKPGMNSQETCVS